MKTLILNGSPRKAGETAVLLDAVKGQLEGEVLQINAFDQSIRPCTDCRYCRTHEGCAIRDGGAALLETIAESDCILIASPIWFGSLSGPLLSMLSRLQSPFSAEFFRKKAKLGSPKRGAILLTGGGTGGAEGALKTARILLRQMNAKEIMEPVCSLQTDRIPAKEDTGTMAAAQKIAEYFNQK